MMTRSELCSDGVATTTSATIVAEPLLPAPRGAAEAAFNQAMRIAPFAILRSALFGVVMKGKRKHLDKALLPSSPEFTLWYTGLQLDQKDEDVWLELVDMLKYEPTGRSVTTTVLELLVRLEKTDTGPNRSVLLGQLMRLRATAINVRSLSGESYIGGLIDTAELNENTGKLDVWLNPKIAALFSGSRFTRMRLEVRRGLSPLSKWLYGYYSSHIQPSPITVKEIHRLCGSSATDSTKFKYSVRGALKELKVACDKHNENFNWRVDKSGTVHADWRDSEKYKRWRVKNAKAKSCG